MVQQPLAVLLGRGGQGSAVVEQQPSYLLQPQEQSHRQGDMPMLQEHLSTWSPQLLEM